MTLAAILARHRGEPVPAVPVVPRPAGTTQSQAGRTVPVVPIVPARNSNIAARCADDLRVRLLDLATRSGVAASVVESLSTADVAACEGLPVNTLRAYLRAAERAACMDAGGTPAGYTTAVLCDGCGPVWLWGGAPARLAACPWCFRRKAGQRFARPPVACGHASREVGR